MDFRRRGGDLRQALVAIYERMNGVNLATLDAYYHGPFSSPD